MTAIEYLDQQVKAVCPKAHGVSIGKWDDKATWRVFSDDPAEQAKAQAIFSAFDKDVYEKTAIRPLTLEQRLAALEAKLK